ncbi:pyridoxamine 5'-phosphate oxidase-domain-containing protein [Yarrowia lipolytica]|nr:pyridoxamine 5'-phosphate oxidase-domain-containing protein [Yarrowia lipolytica]KAE8174935.1 pyridoxamine 5'-phosphate oxidase-domain-containing protein [Yarrowia lipolytica]RMJ00807.1 pyridoxamine 5'-phosphate oxidase-domain-containing protein [Yarrowia lipolytica]
MSNLPSWVPEFERVFNFKKHEGPLLFTLATVDQQNRPRARTCVCRGWLFNSRNTGVLLFTTDRRMDKTSQLAENDAFEAVFYSEAHHAQFRIQGFAKLLSDDMTPAMAHAPGSTYDAIGQVLYENKNKDQLYRTVDDRSYPIYGNSSPQGLSPTGSPKPDDFEAVKSRLGNMSDTDSITSSDETGATSAASTNSSPSSEEWNKEYHRVWDSLSPTTKSSFRKPQPRSLMSDDKKKQLDKFARGVDGEHEDLSNFVVVLLCPNRVDFCTVDGAGYRNIFTRLGEDEWREQERSDRGARQAFQAEQTAVAELHKSFEYCREPRTYPDNGSTLAQPSEETVVRESRGDERMQKFGVFSLGCVSGTVCNLSFLWWNTPKRLSKDIRKRVVTHKPMRLTAVLSSSGNSLQAVPNR